MSQLPNIEMFVIEGNSKLNELAKEIAIINQSLYLINKDLIEIDSEIEVLNNKTNMYVGNVLSFNKFDQNAFTLFIDEDHTVDIHPSNVFLDENGKELETIIKSDLPSPLHSKKSNLKTVKKILDFIEQYNELLDEYNLLIEESEYLTKEHKDLWSKAKRAVKTTNFLTLSSDKQVEKYDARKHALIIAQHDNGTWGFKYIYKKDEKTVNEYAQSLFNPE